MLKIARFRSYLAVAACVLLAMPAVAQERIPDADRVVRLTLPLDGQQVTGVIASYDPIIFTLKTEHGEKHRILWNAIPAPNLDRYWRFLERPDGDAQALFELGDLLIRHRDGKTLAEKAFEQALAIDPDMAQAIERSREGESADGSPRFVGTADPQMWGELSEEVMQQSVASLQAYCERVNRELSSELSLYQSDRFMVLTDVGEKEVQNVAAKLNEAYRATARLLGDDPNANIFRGKCLILLFGRRVDYVRFQRDLHETDARGTGGLCHGFGDGHVHVAAYYRLNRRQTHHILVHEFVHAYLHRYRTPVPIDDWLNEGLAEHLAHEIEPPPGDNLFFKARLSLENKVGLGEGFYDSDRLASWQYDVAGALTRFLLERSNSAYPRLIQAIKAGQPAAEALQSIYRMQPRVLTQRFKRRLDRELNQKLGG